MARFGALSGARQGYIDNINNAELLNYTQFERSEQLRFNTGTSTIAAGSTKYPFAVQVFGSGGLRGDETFVEVKYLITRAGTLKNLIVAAGEAPGAGESYVYTVRKNDVDTTLTATLSGATETEDSDTTNTVTVAVGDRITVSVVNSAGGAVTEHAAAMEFEG